MEKGKREREREREFTRYITRRRNRTSRVHQSYRVASCFLSVSRKTSGARFCARAKACLCLKRRRVFFFFFGSSFTREVFDFADDGRRRPFGCLPRFSKKEKKNKKHVVNDHHHPQNFFRLRALPKRDYNNHHGCWWWWWW